MFAEDTAATEVYALAGQEAGPMEEEEEEEDEEEHEDRKDGRNEERGS